MEVYRTKDGQVSKYIHDDGSETTVKSVSSCANTVNKITGNIEPIEVDREKYSVFISSSVGCPLGCKFCYLTLKKFPYHKLECNNIINNVKEALRNEVKDKPELRDKYIKLSWMGMGDALLLEPYYLRKMSESLVEWSIGDSNFARGLDGVDISTIMPNGANGWPHQLALLNDYLRGRYRTNIHNGGRSIVRLFYSFHSAMYRTSLIPNGRSVGVEEDLKKLSEFKEWYGIDVILHQLFLAGENDSDTDIRRLIKLINDFISNAELRILRYNECEASPYKESPRFDELVKMCAAKLNKVKYQVSAGSEIKASCGQFLCSTLKGKE